LNQVVDKGSFSLPGGQVAPREKKNSYLTVDGLSNDFCLCSAGFSHQSLEQHILPRLDVDLFAYHSGHSTPPKLIYIILYIMMVCCQPVGKNYKGWFAVEVDVAFDPVDVGPFGTDGVVFEVDGVANLVEQFLRGWFHRFSLLEWNLTFSSACRTIFQGHIFQKRAWTGIS
jgi:hypothetical protein